MSYTLPVFNLDCRLTTDVTSPNEGPTWTTNVRCQKYIPSRLNSETVFTQFYPAAISSIIRFEPVAFYALFPRSLIHQWALTFLELAGAGSERWYRIYRWEIQHEGFVNEYPFVVACICDHTDWALFLTPGSANQNPQPAAFPGVMGPISP